MNLIKNKNMTREEIIKSASTPALLEELDYLVETSRIEEREEPYSYDDALDFVEDSDFGQDRKMKLAIRNVYIALGDYSPITEEQYNSIESSGDKRISYPKVKGQRYEWVGSCRTMGLC